MNFRLFYFEGWFQLFLNTEPLDARGEATSMRYKEVKAVKSLQKYQILEFKISSFIKVQRLINVWTDTPGL